MAIKDTLKFITIEEFKAWDGFNEILFDEITAPDSDITTAIIIATSNINYLTGFAISKIWPEDTDNPSEELKDIINNVKIATALYTRYLISNGDPDYLKGQAAISQGGITYSQSNPEDPYFIPPEVFNYLKDIEKYTSFKGFNIDKIVNPKYNPLQQFMGTGGEHNYFEQYLAILNIIQGYGLKIELLHKPNIRGTEVKFSIDESIIPNIDELNKKLQELDNRITENSNNITKNSNTILEQGNTINEILNNLDLKVDKSYVDNQYNTINIRLDDLSATITDKQDKLISGNNIKTINNESILGSGNINVITDKQFTDEEAINLKLINNKSIFAKDNADNDYFAGFITPFDIVSDIDQTKKKFHADYNTWQLFNSDGKSVIFGRDDIRFTDSNNAVTAQYTSDGKLLYGETESLAEILNINDIEVTKPITIIKEL